MKTSEIIALVGLCFSGILFISSMVMSVKNFSKEREGLGGKTAKMESNVEYIKVQTELINAQNKEIAAKLDSQNDRLIILEQTVQNAKINDVPLQLARLDESLKSAHKRINEIGAEITELKKSQKE